MKLMMRVLVATTLLAVHTCALNSSEDQVNGGATATDSRRLRKRYNPPKKPVYTKVSEKLATAERLQDEFEGKMQDEANTFMRFQNEAQEEDKDFSISHQLMLMETASRHFLKK